MSGDFVCRFAIGKDGHVGFWPALFADTLPDTEALLYAPRMSWRNELKLGDLPAGEALEIACPKCGAARYATVAELSAHKMPGALPGETVSLATAYLDQVEARLRCRRCGGPGRLSRVWQDKISGFVGGMP